MPGNLNWHIFIILFVASTISACSRDSETNDLTPVSKASELQTELAGDSRPAQDRERDASRKPAEIMAYLGVEKGMRVVDIVAAGGYYTEALAVAVGPEGQVVALNPPTVLAMSDGIYEEALRARLADNRLPNVTRLDKELADIVAADGPFDLALIALNLHDIYNNSPQHGAENFLRIVYSLLKPGGVLGIIDHAGNPDANNKELHRMDKAVIFDAAAAAGLVVEAESDLLKQAGDDHTRSVFDPDIQGNTDRFVLRLRRPTD